MFKRKQQDVSDGSKHWYQDKYQHVLTQRNILALISIGALVAASIAGFAVMQLAPLKSVEPYLIQIDEKSGITQRVTPVTRKEYSANEAVDRYFTATYLRMRESYNYNILRYNDNIVRLMSAPGVYSGFRRSISPANEEGFVKRLGPYGQREVRIRDMAYIVDPNKKKSAEVSLSKILQARITTVEIGANASTEEKKWVVTVTFEYADLKLNQQDQLHNPLGYTVTSYQIQLEGE